jgi:hypothetical protein
MSNSYPKLLEAGLEALDSPRGLSPAALSERIFDALVADEPSIADTQAFRRCELGQFAQRGLHEKVRKDIRNQTSPDARQQRLFPDLDLRYTVVHDAGVERQIEHAHMTRPEWLSAEACCVGRRRKPTARPMPWSNAGCPWTTSGPGIRN